MLVDFNLCRVAVTLGTWWVRIRVAPHVAVGQVSLSLGGRASVEISRVRRREDVQEEPREVEAGDHTGFRVSYVGRYSFEFQPAGMQV